MSAAREGTASLDAALAAVALARRAGASDADAWVSAGQTSSVRVHNGVLDERIDTASDSLTLRVFVASRTATMSTSDLDRDALTRLAADAVALASLADPDPCAGLPDAPLAADTAADGLDLADPALIAPAPGLLFDLAMRADAAARGRDPRLRSGEGVTATRWAGAQTLANSRGFAASYPATSCTLWVSVAIDDAGGKKREGWWYAAGRRLAAIADAEAIGRAAAERALGQLGARPVPTQEAPVVWAPQAGCSFLDMLARAVSGDARYRGVSFLIGREGERVASPLVTIVDDATLPGRISSRPFDAEGVASQRTPIVADGMFAGFLYDSYSARKARRQSTGNAGRSTFPRFGSEVTVTPSNLALAPRASPPEAIVADIATGLYLTDTLGFGENLTTGDFSRGAAGFWIENGELAFPVDEINISGRLQEMLTGIDAVGTDPLVIEAISSPTFRVDRMMISGR